ncbi:hypothetical protein SAMN05443248_0286 [Bradyrhizobium erythrophlei]|uniref:Uncharacterized protein n=2 Tax=Bradyrhizobium erythrophlei TaxID=1437360 RepID=A0A1M5H2A2_9BRAD|nr:hypothetical protein SAMN05443248_0286 [Bradyrhizobium erythrophlei]
MPVCITAYYGVLRIYITMYCRKLPRHALADACTEVCEAANAERTGCIKMPNWGVQLIGHDFDLADWAEVLQQPFDPWVMRSNDAFVLRWTGFDDLETASEVQEHAAFVVDQLNGAMWINRGTRAVRFEGIINFKPDGTRNTTMMVATGKIEARARVSAEAVVTRADGTIIPPPPPKSSNAQDWIALAETHEPLADALVYFARAEWFDIYKAVECLEDWVGGGEAGLRDLNWIEKDDLKRLKRTANSYRHRRGGKHSPPEIPVSQSEAREMLAILIRKAFLRAAEKAEASLM